MIFFLLGKENNNTVQSRREHVVIPHFHLMSQHFFINAQKDIKLKKKSQKSKKCAMRVVGISEGNVKFLAWHHYGIRNWNFTRRIGLLLKENLLSSDWIIKKNVSWENFFFKKICLRTLLGEISISKGYAGKSDHSYKTCCEWGTKIRGSW